MNSEKCPEGEPESHFLRASFSAIVIEFLKPLKVTL
jgi:hypothetical protein